MVQNRSKNYDNFLELKHLILAMEAEYEDSGLMDAMKQSLGTLVEGILLDTDHYPSNSHLF
jgi:hypothetical protein